MSVLLLLVLAPFFMALLVPFLHNRVRAVHAGWFVLLLPLALFMYLISLITTVAGGQILTGGVAWVPSLGIRFTVLIDGLGLLFALLITGLGALVTLYSIYYLKAGKEALASFYTYLLLFMGAMLGVVLSGNLIVLYLFWELTSLSSALLIGYWFHRERSRYGALKSMLVTVSGGFAMLAGFILLYVMSGSFQIREIIARADVVAAHPLFLPAMLLVLLGAFTKSAQFPFHIWLPDAMEAPTPVSAYLHSATMVKAGLYLVARLTPVFALSLTWFWILTFLGLITLLWGAFYAIRQTDLKALLALSTVSQLGLIMCLLGLASAAYWYDYDALYTLAALAAVFHLVNHAAFKGCLFMVAGIVDHESGTRDLRLLGGLRRVMPVTFILTLIGAFSMAGIFPLSGFLSKELFFAATVNALQILPPWGIILPAVAVLASVFTFVYSMMVVFRTFTGPYHPENLPQEPHEAPAGMLAAPAILALLVVVFGLFPNLLSSSLIAPAMQSIYPLALPSGQMFPVHIKPWHGWTPELFMTIAVVAGGILVYLRLSSWVPIYRTLRLDKKDPFDHLYDYLVEDWLVNASIRTTRVQMTGLLRDYLLFILVFTLGMMFVALFSFQGVQMPRFYIAEVPFYLWVLMAIPLVAAVFVPMARNRVTAIVLISLIGFHMALFFVLFRAPDLALTKLLFETVMTALFLLAFFHLPELRRDRFKPRLRVAHLFVSLGVGVMVTITALSAFAMSQTRPFAPISRFFLDNAYELAGGKNVVNVILVDFRGLDTLLEVLVLATAALGIVALVKLQFKGDEDI